MRIPIIAAIAVAAIAAVPAQSQSSASFFSYSVREAAARPWPGALTNRVAVQAAGAAFYKWNQVSPHPQRARTRNSCSFIKTRTRLTGNCARRSNLVPTVQRMTFTCNKSARGNCRMTFPRVVQVPPDPPVS